MRRAARRDVSEKPIVDALRRCGWFVDHLSIPDGPDLLISKAGRTVLAEVKTGKAKLRKGQAEWHARWTGGPIVVLRTVDDALALERALGKASE